MERKFGHIKQRGAALMVMLVIMVLGVSTFLVGSLSSTALLTKQHESTAVSLALAKSALIGFAITYGDTHSLQVHGYLPCPDPNGTVGANGEGSSETCGNQNVSSIGRLPWKTLQLPALRDGNGECLWYAVAGTYKNNPMTNNLMNSDNPGLFEILDASGTTIAQNVVAVIFSPGAVLGSQNRTPDNKAPVCGGNYTATNYLDSDGVLNNGTVSASANAITQFRMASSAQVNDQMIYITKDDIFDAIYNIDPARNPLRLMTKKAAECIANFGSRGISSIRRLPWAGRLLSPSTNYITDAKYDDENGRMAGRLPFRVNSSYKTLYPTSPVGDNLIDTPWYQLASNGNNCPNVTDWSSYYPWWSNWKDHLYYALADHFKPGSASLSFCSTCLRVNSSGQYAAVVMFAGRPLAGQSRASTSDHLDLRNYLEGLNFANVNRYDNVNNQNLGGNSNYQSGAESGSFNDVLYCIKPDFTVTAC